MFPNVTVLRGVWSFISLQMSLWSSHPPLMAIFILNSNFIIAILIELILAIHGNLFNGTFYFNQIQGVHWIGQEKRTLSTLVGNYQKKVINKTKKEKWPTFYQSEDSTVRLSLSFFQESGLWKEYKGGDARRHVWLWRGCVGDLCFFGRLVDIGLD